MRSLQVENGMSVAHNEEKVKRTSSCFLCSYVNMDIFVPKFERGTFSLSQMNNAKLARTLSWRENGLSVAHNEEKVKNVSLCFLCSYVKSGRVYANTRKGERFR